MQEHARVTSKGQVTVPHKIRRLLGVRTGDQLIFEGNSRGVRLRLEKKASPFAMYRGIGNSGIGRGRKAVTRWVRKFRGE